MLEETSKLGSPSARSEPIPPVTPESGVRISRKAEAYYTAAQTHLIFWRLRRHPLGNPRSALPATNDQPAVTCQLNGDLLGQLSDPRRMNRNGTIGATRWSYPAVNDTGCGERPATTASRLLVSTTRFREQRGGFEEKTSRQDVMLETSVTAGHDEEASHPLPTRMTLMTDPP